MKRIRRLPIALAILAGLAIHPQKTVLAKGGVCGTCPVSGVVSTATQSLGAGTPSGGTCSTGKGANGYPIPDPKCTPGAFNPTVTVARFGARGFTTKCVRDCLTNGKQKAATYKSYRISQNPSCELDHLVPLEMGGADSLDNIWPQCGQAPDGRNYKDIKDQVEQYLAIQVVLGMDIDQARSGVATDWSQYISAAEAFCAAQSCDIQTYRK
jgi:hypothetical protein